MKHEFIEVGNRRWCVGCSLFQNRRGGAHPEPWREPASACPRDTPWANDKDRPLLQMGEDLR